VVGRHRSNRYIVATAKNIESEEKLLSYLISLSFSFSLSYSAILIIAFVEIGFSAVPALLIIIFLVPLQFYLSNVKSKMVAKNQIVTYERFRIMTEILTAMKLIKFYAWEKPFCDQIKQIRNKEMHLLKRTMITNAFYFMIVFSVPILVAFFALLTYWLSGQVVDPVVGFTVVSILDTLRYPLFMAPLAVNSASGSSSGYNYVNLT
jgi:ABC-type transport system involved in cytochrome bd biosynthesis fused ATPase/permease subunit